MLEAITPFLTPIVAGVAAWIAIRTLKLRIRVDHADQWWKRVQYGVDKALESGGKSQVVGMDVIESLLDPVLKPNASYEEKVNYNIRIKQLKKVGWKVSQSEKDMLERISAKLLLGAPQPLSPDDLKEITEESKMDVTETKGGGMNAS
ncbi:MAG TPA: hypothetical protein DCY59_10270 [Micrococcaceae bacterium]|nr:hypothetical protein [Micrococcaceae bacterium]